MSDNTAETRIQIVRAILDNIGFDIELAEFVEALSPYFGTVYTVDPQRRHLICDDNLAESVARDMGITEALVGERLAQCIDSQLFIQTAEPGVYEVATWLDWLYSDRSHKAEIITKFTIGIMELHFYDDNDNVVYSEGFVMDDSKVPFQNTPEVY